MKPKAFTLIELLIVVMIIAILAAIAIPNMLLAQMRAKVARVKSDMRTVSVSVESYRVDSNDYPPSFGVVVNGKNWAACLSTPVQYLTGNSPITDPFGRFFGSYDDTLMSYEGVNSQGHQIEQPNSPPWTVMATPGEKTLWWWLLSRGPDGRMGFQSPGTEEGNIRQYFFESDLHPDKWLGIVYDATNGTVSDGNIYRAGGSVSNYAGRSMGQ